MATSLVPYLVMNGNAQEAIKFYVEALDGEVIGNIDTFGGQPESPDFPMPAEMKDKVMHAMIKVGTSELMFSDTFPGQPHSVGNQVTICLMADSLDQSKKFFEALQQGGTVNMPLQETDFSPGYAVVVDKFGVTFQIYTEGKQ